MTQAYKGWGLANPAHYDILSRFSPRFDVVRADHVTLDLCKAEDAPPPPAEIIAYGRLYLLDEGFDILAVAVNGRLFQPREDRMFHITLSHQKGLSSGYSGLLLKKFDEKVEIIPPFHVQTTPFVRMMGWRPDRP